MTVDLSFLICEVGACFKLLSGMFIVSNRPSECVSPAQELFARLICVCKNDVYVCKNDVWCCPQTQCV